jgi:hypothetical protein
VGNKSPRLGDFNDLDVLGGVVGVDDACNPNDDGMNRTSDAFRHGFRACVDDEIDKSSVAGDAYILLTSNASKRRRSIQIVQVAELQ